MESPPRAGRNRVRCRITCIPNQVRPQPTPARGDHVACMGAISWAVGYSTCLKVNGEIRLGLMMLIDEAGRILLLAYEAEPGARAFCRGTIPAGTIMITGWRSQVTGRTALRAHEAQYPASCAVIVGRRRRRGSSEPIR